MEKKKWFVEISQKYVVLIVGLGAGDKEQSTMIAGLNFLADCAQSAVELGEAYIRGNDLENAFVSGVVCEDVVQLDFSDGDLPGNMDTSPEVLSESKTNEDEDLEEKVKEVIHQHELESIVPPPDKDREPGTPDLHEVDEANQD